jgi:hypothetical protein
MNEAQGQYDLSSQLTIEIGYQTFNQHRKDTKITLDMLRDVSVITAVPLQNLGRVEVRRAVDGKAWLSFDPPKSFDIKKLKIYCKCLVGSGNWKSVNILNVSNYTRAQVQVQPKILARSTHSYTSDTLWKFRLEYDNVSSVTNPITLQLAKREREKDNVVDLVDNVVPKKSKTNLAGPRAVPTSVKQRQTASRSPSVKQRQTNVEIPVAAPAVPPAVPQFIHDPPRCDICTSPASIVNIPCGHIAMCPTCFRSEKGQQNSKKCWYCNAEIAEHRQVELGDMNCAIPDCNQSRQILLTCGCFRYCSEHANMINSCTGDIQNHNFHKFDKQHNKVLRFRI